jgi:hypothetical protein
MNTDELLEYFDTNGLGNHIKTYEINTTQTKFTYKDLLKLFKIYHVFCKREKEIFDTIYCFHGCDSWEDIFRDYDKQYLYDKTIGVEIAIKEVEDVMDVLCEEKAEEVIKEVIEKVIEKVIEENTNIK